MPEPNLEVHNEGEVREYFARLEREYPQLIEAMKVMNISYQQYLTALLALTRQQSFSTGSAPAFPIVTCHSSSPVSVARSEPFQRQITAAY